MTDKVNQNTELQETNHSPWAQSVPAVLDALDVAAEQGLARETVRRRRKEYGKNRLRHTARRSAWQILYEQFKSLVVLLLIVAAGISLAFDGCRKDLAFRRTPFTLASRLRPERFLN